MNTKSVISAILVAFMWPLMSFAQANERSLDTLMVNFGNGKVVFLVGGEKDLYQMQKHDLNALVNDIAIKIDTVNGSTYLTISDPSGRKYLKSNIASIEKESAEIFNSPESLTSNSVIKAEEKKKRSIRKPGVRTFTNFEFGLNNYLEGENLPDAFDAPYSLNAIGSFTAGINFIGKTNVLGPLFLEWGPGLSFHQFRMEEPNYRIYKNTQDRIVEFEDIQGVEAVKSQFNTTYLNFSVMPSLDLGWFNSKNKRRFYKDWRGYSSRGLRVGLGGYAGYRVASRSRFEYKIAGDRSKEIERSNYYLNPWRYGIKAQVGWRGIDLFATYDVNPLFAKNRGMNDLNMITFGIIL